MDLQVQKYSMYYDNMAFREGCTWKGWWRAGRKEGKRQEGTRWEG